MLDWSAATKAEKQAELKKWFVENKRFTAEDQGYKVFYIWESDYRADPEGTVKKVAEEIKSLL